MYSSNTINILGFQQGCQAEKRQQLYRSKIVLYPRFEHLAVQTIKTGFRNFQLYKKGNAILVNSQTTAFNTSFDENKKIGFKRLNIINLLAKTHSNQDISWKERNSQTTLLKSLESENGLLQNDIKQGEEIGKNRPVTTAKPSYFFRYSRVNEYKKLGIELASPDKIRKWAERLLPTGRIVGLVLNANTLHHKTLKPLKGGLFCERIFGPTKDFRCACGKTITKRTRMQNTTYSAGLINLLTPTGKPIKRFFCKSCEVEYTWALTRRYQLGYISLAFPVTHLWYTKGFSSPISLLLDIHKYDLDSIIYCSQTTSLEKSYEITEMGISLKASQVLSYVRKTSNFPFKSNPTLLQDVRNKNQALVNARLSKRKKALEQGFVAPLDATKMTFQAGQNTENGKQFISNIQPEPLDSLTKDISDFKTLEQTLKVIQRNIEETSLPAYINNFSSSNKQNSFLPKNDNYLITRINQKGGRRAVVNNQVVEQSSFKENEPSLLLQSLLLPLIVTYSTQFFAPFVVWLLAVGDDKNTVHQMSLSMLSKTLLQQIFTKTIYSDSSAQNEINTMAGITQTLAQLKLMFTESLDTLESLPDIIERKYHKALLESRKNIQTLPVQTFGQINKYFYKQAYTSSLRQTKELLKNLKSMGRQEIDVRNFTTETLTRVKVRYFLQQLKDLVAKPPTRKISYNVDLKQLALHFFLYKLKKNQAAKGSSNNQRNIFELPYLKTINLNDSQVEPFKQTLIRQLPSSNKPTLSFYYNLYGIADDHLWDNINDWNLVKSYITIYPDVMDQVIPAYNYRIPSSNMTNFAKQQIRQVTSSLVQQYKNLPKKYLYGYLQSSIKTSSMNADGRKPQFVNNRTNTVNIEQTFDVYRKSAKNNQALPIKSTGAGIINMLINSITLIELQAMDKHFTFLLKESQKAILTYKTKIKPAGAKYSLQPTEEKFGQVPNTSGTEPFLSTNQVHKQDLFYADTKVDEYTHNPGDSNLEGIETRQRILPPSRTDRYAGIDKFMEKHHDLLRRAKVVRKFAMTNVLPKAMILKVLPVLPPELRPIMKMADQIATSDLNRLYQRVLYRNERLNKIVLQLSESVPLGMTSAVIDSSNPDTRKKQLTEYDTKPTNELFETPLFGYEKHYAQRLLQEAVDNLIDNGRAGANTEKDAKGRALKSLSEVLKGKQGRFRQYLLGKRVDYSGRSVIVVGPKLKIHECGLPREMAVELYLPFIIQYLIQMKYTKTVVGAKTLITREKELINSILENVVRGHPIILNRAPTLHRLGFQAFQPILVEGRAILLHPMACTAFNADFDGDQMAVHIPITIEARSEAWRLMLARNNLLSPATGEPIILPSQDMVLGCYYLTTTRKMKYEQLITSNQYFSDVETVLYLYYLGKLHLHTPVWVKTNKIVVMDATKKPLEIRVSVYGAIQEIYSNTEFYYDPQGALVHQYIRTTPGRILFNLIIKNS